MRRKLISTLIIYRAILLMLLPLLLFSCTKEDLSDCSVECRLRLRFDYNMLYADAFTPAVKEGRLYLFDANGKFLQSMNQQGNPLFSLSLPTGEYSALVWAGDFDDTFTFTSFVEATTSMDECLATLQSTTANLGSLFWGRIDSFIVGDKDVEYAVPLIKNTNRIRIVLQHISGEAVNSSDFNFEITDTNGVIDAHNNLMDNDTVQYTPYAKGQQTVGGEPAVTVTYAELATSRLIAGSKARLRITTSDNEVQRTVMDIPLIDYLMLAKTEGGYKMTNQEFLDRQDEYTLHFFLDENNSWLRIMIIINGWVIRINEFE